MADVGTQIRELQAQLGLTQNQTGVMAQTIQRLEASLMSTNAELDKLRKTTSGERIKFVDAKAHALGAYCRRTQ